MFYDPLAIDLAREFMHEENGSYTQLAAYLELFKPKPNGPWTKHSAYHLCRTNNIRSSRRCKNQPFAGNNQRANTCKIIIAAVLNAISNLGLTLRDIPTLHPRKVALLSGSYLKTVERNWPDLTAKLSLLGGNV